MEWLGRNLGFRSPDDWYQLRWKHFESSNLRGLLHIVGSVLAAIRELMPDNEWMPWHLGRVPSGYWHVMEHRLQAMRWLGGVLSFNRPSDWYGITSNHFYQNGLGGLFQVGYRKSVIAALQELMPQHEFPPWRFARVKSGYWRTKQHRAHAMEWLERRLKYALPADWYAVSKADFIQNGCYGILLHHNQSIVSALREYRPNVEWTPWNFVNFSRAAASVRDGKPIWDTARKVPNRFWEDADNRRRYMEWLGMKLRMRRPEDWYRLTVESLRDNKGHAILDYYRRLSKKLSRREQATYAPHVLAVKEYVSDYDWLPWGFGKVTWNFWRWRENRHWYLNWLGSELGFTAPDDWYRINSRTIREHHGTRLLILMGSILAILRDFMPEHEWLPWLFQEHAPQRCWRDPLVRRKYMDWLGERLGFKSLLDWNMRIRAEDFLENQGTALLCKVHKGSPWESLREYAPDHDWKEWLLPVVPRRFWKFRRNRERFMCWLGEELGFSRLEDWYRITKDLIATNGGRQLLKYYHGSPPAAVIDCFLNHEWQPEKFRVREKAQRQLFDTVKQLFPRERVEYNYLHGDIRFRKSGRRMQSDIHIARLRLSFEYQGEQHFIPKAHFGGRKALKIRQSRDREKNHAFRKHPIMLVYIDYTWDGTLESLAAMIPSRIRRKSIPVQRKE